MKNYRKDWFVTLVVMTLFLSACGGGGGGSSDLVEESAIPGQPGPGDTGNYFPFAVGNTWQFRGVSTATDTVQSVTYTNTVTISGSQNINGFAATVFREAISGGEETKGEYYLAKEDSGIFDPGSAYSSDFPGMQLLPYKEVRFPLVAGDSFVQLNRKGIDLGEDLDFDGLNEKIDLISTMTVRGFETVSVPYGTFSNCAVLERNMTLTIFLTDSRLSQSARIRETAWLAANIGWVKIVSTIEFAGFSGTDTEELVGFAQTSNLTTTTTAPKDLTGDGVDLFWSDSSAMPLKKISMTGGEIIPLAKKIIGTPQKFVVQGDFIFWSNGSTLYKQSLLSGASSVLTVKTNQFGSLGELAADADAIYWVEDADNTHTLKKISHSGGTPITLLNTNKTITALALDSSHIYWIEEGSGPITLPNGPEGSAVRRIAKNGGTPETLVNGALNGLITAPPEPFIPGSWFPRGGLVVDGAEVFFGDSNFFDSYRIMKVAVTGGAITVLATMAANDFPRAMTVDPASVFWVDGTALHQVARNGGAVVKLTDAEDTPLDLTFSSGQLFWSETTGPAHAETGRIKTLPSTGGIPTTLHQGGDAPRELFIANNLLYWNEGGAIGTIEGFGRIAAMPQGGGTVTGVVDGLRTDTPKIAVGGGFIFIADGWRVKKVSANGSGIETVAYGGEEISAIASDGTYLYWIQRTGGLYRVPVTGGTSVLLSSTPMFSEIGPIRVAGGFVFWLENGSTIKRVPITGGMPVLVTSGVTLSDFVTDGDYLYLSRLDGAISRQAAAGGAPTTLIQRNYSTGRQLFLSGGNLYWIDEIDVGRIASNGTDTPVYFRVNLFPDIIQGSIWVDNQNVFWTEPGSGVIKKAVPH